MLDPLRVRTWIQKALIGLYSFHPTMGAQGLPHSTILVENKVGYRVVGAHDVWDGYYLCSKWHEKNMRRVASTMDVCPTMFHNLSCWVRVKQFHHRLAWHCNLQSHTIWSNSTHYKYATYEGHKMHHHSVENDMHTTKTIRALAPQASKAFNLDPMAHWEGFGGLTFI